MKKIVSCTIATALATTNLTTVSADTIKSVTKIDDSINANINGIIAINTAFKPIFKVIKPPIVAPKQKINIMK